MTPAVYSARGPSASPHDTGTVLNVLPESECGQFIIKGYVEQHKAAGANSTTIELSTVAGLKDCTGKLIPAVSATGQVANRCVLHSKAPSA